MKTMKIARDLDLPIDAVTQRMAFMGRTGSGKTYGAGKVAEEMATAGAQVVVLDPVGSWWGLRIAADGKSPGISIPVFGGLHGDLPLEVGAGAYIADLIVEKRLSVVLDVSQFETDTAKARFAGDWAKRFFFRQKSAPSAVHVFLEECQEFVPQNPQRGEEHMLHAFNTIWKIGRNFGIGGSLISQRPQEINKKAFNLTECMFAFQMTGPHERKTMKEWMGEKGIDEDIDTTLRKLEVGHAKVWSPVWLKVNGVYRIEPKRTFNASATPEVGKAAVARELAPIDLERIRTEMAATIEKAKADDPKELRKKIGELERELARKPQTVSTPAEPIIEVRERLVEVPMSLDGFTEDIKHWADSIKENAEEFKRDAEYVATKVADLIASQEKVRADFAQRADIAARTIARREILHTPAKSFYPKPIATAVQPFANGNGDGLSKPQVDILRRMAEFRAAQIESVRLSWLAGSMGTTVRARGFEENMRVLRSRELVGKAAGDSVELLPAGFAIVGEQPTLTGPMLHAKLMDLLSGPQWNYLEELLRHPHGVTAEDLATHFDTTIRARGFEENVRTLRAYDLVEKKGERLVAAEWVR